MTQEEALAIIKTGANVFLTGEPGSGKTHTINRYVAYLRDHGIEPSVTASTGIAATHIGGMTIHSWSGIGIRKTLSEYDLEAMEEKESLVRRVRSAKVLIIDEISMMEASLLNLVDLVLRRLRRREEPFGGIQVIFVGDFFQLPPVARLGDGAPRFAFESEAWRNSGALMLYLSEQHRQEDQAFLDILGRIRRGDLHDRIHDVLSSRKISSNVHVPGVTRLYSHNADVDQMNGVELSRLSGKIAKYVMTSSGNERLIEGLKKNCLSPEILELKEGAAVMFTKNNLEQGFVNGTLGVIDRFDRESGLPVVRTRDHRTIYADTMEWVVEDGGKTLAKITQIPLRLAWAMTVHKSQGMSMDAAIIDLGSAFEYGQGYVALSRVRTLSGLHLLAWNTRALHVHPRILEVDRAFRSSSDEARKEFVVLGDKELTAMHENMIHAMGGKKQKREPQEQKAKTTHSDQEPKKKAYSVEKMRETHANAYRPWSQEDDHKLRALFLSDVPKRALSAMFGRKSGAIHSRLKKLGLIEE